MKADAFERWMRAELDVVERALEALGAGLRAGHPGEAMRSAVLDGGNGCGRSWSSPAARRPRPARLRCGLPSLSN
jgi:hypothetical protein